MYIICSTKGLKPYNSIRKSLAERLTMSESKVMLVSILCDASSDGYASRVSASFMDHQLTTRPELMFDMSFEFKGKTPESPVLCAVMKELQDANTGATTAYVKGGDLKLAFESKVNPIDIAECVRLGVEAAGYEYLSLG